MKNKLVQMLAASFALLCMILIGLTHIISAQSPDLQPSENTQIPMSIQTELTQPVNVIQSPTAEGDLDLTFDGDGIVATTFGNNYDQAGALAIQSDGKIIIAGFTSPDSPNNNGDMVVIRYNANGSFDTSFGNGGSQTITFGSNNDRASAIAIQSDGKIVAAGFSSGTNGADFAIIRLNTNGSLDTTFGTNGGVLTNVGTSSLASDSATSLVIQSDGKIAVAGKSDTSSAIVRYNTNGSLDTSFGTGGKVVGTIRGSINSLASQSDGKITAAGISTINATEDFAVIRYNSNGSLDSTIGIINTPIGSFNDGANSVAIQSDGKIVVGGYSIADSSNSDIDFALVRYNTDRSLDNSFGTGGKVITTFGNAQDLANSIAIQQDGRIVAAGSTRSGNGGFAFARYNLNGTLDNSFGSSGKIITPIGSNSRATANAIVIQSDGKIVATGYNPSNETTKDDIILTRYLSRGCPASSLISFGQTVTGSLQSGDCRYTDNSYFDDYAFSGTAGQQISISMDSGNFNAYLFLYQGSYPGGTPIASDNDGGGGTNARIPANSGFLTLPATGTYTILANSFAAGETGNYTLTLNQAGCAYSISPPNNSVSATSGLGNFNVTVSSGCFWSAVSNDNSWLSITSVTPVNGNGTLSYSFTANPGTSPRIGTITLTNTNQTLIHTVTQAGNTIAIPRRQFDFDGDGKADVSVFRPSNGTWYLQQSSAGFTGAAFGFGTDKLVPGDYDGDGKTDIAVYRGGTWYLQRSQSGFTGIAFGDANDIPVPADYDGDGKTDVAVFRPSNGTWYLLQSTAGFTGVAFGISTDKPVAADYDGDGKADIAVNRSGIWYIQRSQLGFTGLQFGDSNDKLVPADYDGDGKADVAVFRPSNGTWYLLQSAAGFTGLAFGLGTDLPTPADYDGDGKADVAVFRNGTWYLQRSTQGFTGVAFGVSTDAPIPNVYVR